MGGGWSAVLGSPRAAVPRALDVVVRALPCAAWLAPRPRRAVTGLAATCAALVVLALLLAAVAPLPAACWRPAQVVAIAAGAAGALLCGARALLVARERAAWLVAAVAMAVALVRDGLWVTAVDGRLTRVPPVPYVVLGLVVLAAGTAFLVLLMRARFTTARGTLLEAAGGALVLPVLLMALALTGVLPSGGRTAAEHAVWAIDPVVGAGVLCVLLSVVSASGWRPGSTWALLLGAGVAGFSLALLVARDSRVLGDAFLPLFLVMTTVPALAAWQLPPTRPLRPRADGRALAGPLAVATLALAFLMADRLVDRPLAVTALVGAGLTLSALRAASLYATARTDRLDRPATPPPPPPPGPPAAAPTAAPTAPSPPSPAVAGLATLTARELEVVGLLADGRLHKQVAHDLGLSPRTVEKHVAGARRKLGVRTNNELILLLNGSGRPAAGPA